MVNKEEVRTIKMDETKFYLKCLKCDKPFPSYGIQNRVCNNCNSNKKDTTDWMLGK